jgi:hypothetical protein
MNNLLLLLIGGTGQGKTTLMKQIIAKRPCLVFDVNGEHTELPTDNTQLRSRFFGDYRDFMTLCANKHGNTVCVFEEATGFLVGSMQKDIRAFCVAKRHPVQKGGRTIVMLFHTISSVPPFLLAMADRIVLFKTGDNPNDVKKKAPSLLHYFLKLKNAPKYTKFVIKNIN